MKVVFDTDEQMEEFIEYMSRQKPCPHMFGLKEKCTIDNECYDCWKQALNAEVTRNENNI